MKRFQVVFDENFKPTFKAENSWQLFSLLTYLVYPYFPAGIKEIKNKETGEIIPYSDIHMPIAELKCARSGLQEKVLGSDKDIPREPTEIYNRYEDLKEKALDQDKSVLDLLLDELDDEFEHFPVPITRS